MSTPTTEEQLDMFDFSTHGARPTDPETSWEAARRGKALRGKDRARALLMHASCPDGLTDFELGDLIGRQQTSAGKRRGELRDLGLIAETDGRRLAPSGSPAIVWRITATGLSWAKALRAEGTQ